MNVYKEMESALNTALITAFPTTQIYFENQDGNDAGETPFLVCNFLPAAPEILEPLYNGSIRHNAVYQVTICVQKGIGKYLVNTYLETLMNTFRRGSYLTSGGVTTRVVTCSPESANVPISDNGIYEVPVTVVCFATYPDI